MSPKICCVTGHRSIPAEKIDFVTSELKREILLAIEDGFTHFISGFADGVDLIFAEIVVELKPHYSISLEAAIPYRNRMNTKSAVFHNLIKECSIIGVHSEEYIPSCFMKRNRFMVQMSDRVIAVYDGREKSGTAFTMCYARATYKEVKVIEIDS